MKLAFKNLFLFSLLLILHSCGGRDSGDSSSAGSNTQRQEESEDGENPPQKVKCYMQGIVPDQYRLSHEISQDKILSKCPFDDTPCTREGTVEGKVEVRDDGVFRCLRKQWDADAFTVCSPSEIESRE